MNQPAVNQPRHIAVLGAGAWGTALALQLSQRHRVSLWTRSAEHALHMQQSRCNPQFLDETPFPEGLQVVAELATALQDVDMVLSVVPTAGLRHIMRQVRELGCSAPLIWASKGLEAASSQLAHEIAAAELPAGQHYGVLSGPSFAAELVRGLPTAVTLACPDAAFAREAGAWLHGANLRVYTSDDVVGVSVAGAVKNVMAIAAGISDGMQFGNNARAALITRGMAEMTRFGLALGGKKDTFMGLSGVGDLILTCTGQYSRNREVGLRLATGQHLPQILEQLGHVAEGVHTAREVVRRAAQLGVDMPISREVERVLFEQRAPRDAVETLLGREQKAECD